MALLVRRCQRLTVILSLLCASCAAPLSTPAATDDPDISAGKADSDATVAPALSGYQTRHFLMGAVRTGLLPKGVEISPDGRWLYTSDMGEPTVTAVDLARLAELRREAGGRYVASDVRTGQALIDFLTDTNVYDAATDWVDRIHVAEDDPALRRTIATPFGYSGAVRGNIEVLFLPNTPYALTTELEREVLGGRGQVTVIDTRTHTVVAEIPTNGRGSKVMALAPQPDARGRRVLYVSNWFSNDITVIHLDEAVLAAEIDAYAAEPGRHSDLAVDRVRLVTSNPHPSQPFPIAPRGIAFTHDGRYALVAAYNSRTLHVVDAKTHRQLAEVAPLPSSVGSSSFRHVVLTADGRTAYVSLMSADAVIRFDVDALVAEVDEALADSGHPSIDRTLTARDGRPIPVIDSDLWLDVLLPWAGGSHRLTVTAYPDEHSRPTSLRGADFRRADPNTIVLDPREPERYLYVSCRTTKGYPPRDGRYDWDGKIDVVDLHAGRVIFTLVGGPESTGLAITPDGRTLASTDYRGHRVRLFDVGALTDLYERASESTSP